MSFGNKEELYQALYVRWNALFFDQLTMAGAALQPFMSLVAMPFSSSAAVEEHVFMNAVPAMKEWLDERQISRLSGEKFQIVNKDWANAVEIDRNDVRRERFDIIDRSLMSLADQAAINKINLIVELFNNARVNLGYDGVPMISAAHPRTVGADQSNLLTDALDSDSLQAAYIRLKTIRDDQNERMNLNPTHLVTGPDLEFKAKELVMNEYLANGATNINRGLLTPVSVDGINAGLWFVCDFSKPIKPFIDQEETMVSFDILNRPTDPNMFHSKKILAGADYSGNAGNALWQLMVGSDSTT